MGATHIPSRAFDADSKPFERSDRRVILDSMAGDMEEIPENERAVHETRGSVGALTDLDVAKDQIKNSRAWPKGVPLPLTARNLIDGIDQFLGEEFENKYEINYYSAKDTKVPRYHGVNAWLEVVDIKSGKIVADYNIEYASGMHDRSPKGEAEGVLTMNDRMDYNFDKDRLSGQFFRGNKFVEFTKEVAKNIEDQIFDPLSN